MKKIIYFFCIIFVISGCAAVVETSVESPAVETVSHEPVSIEKVSEVIKEEPKEQVVDKEEQPPEILKGIIFGKTVFLGLLKDRVIRLMIENIDKPGMQFEFQIESLSNKQILPWDIKHLDPGHFFIELPEGGYRISKISFFVGTTLASEDIDLQFQVIPEGIVYLGTMKIDGTKERIKLGGLPLIQPGFEYTVQIVDELDRAKDVLQKSFPGLTGDVDIGLMSVRPLLK